jgi:pimeloyl-ACP methyl ester carboxylesterase
MTTKQLVMISVVVAYVSTSAASLQTTTKDCSDHTLATQGLSLYYMTCGHGPPLLLLHRFFGNGTFSWGRSIPTLAAKYRLIVPDLRGHGRSTNPSGEFTHRQSATDMFALLDSLGLQQVKAMGMSSGALTLLHMATRQPSRIDAMVLIGATTYWPEQARKIFHASPVESLTAQEYEEQRGRHERGDEQYRELQKQFHAFKDSYDDMTFTSPDLSKITAHTLIIHGDRDEFFPIEIPMEMYTSIPKSYLWIVPNGGHLAIADHVDGFTVQATQFLSGDWNR